MATGDPALAARPSNLIVPGDQPTQVAGAGRFGAAQVVFDLADLDPPDKDVARDGIAAALEANNYGDALVAVRINPTDSMWAYRDIVERAGEFFDGITLSGVTSPSDVEFVDTLVGTIEQRIDLGHRIDIEAEIATAQGLALLEEIALASDRLDAPGARRRRPASNGRIVVPEDIERGSRTATRRATRWPTTPAEIVALFPRMTPCVPSPSTRGRRDARESTAGRPVARRLPVTSRVASWRAHRLFRHASAR